ncbi:MAG: transglutaminase family protein [Akkermansiaceae bacterium]|nr:transglutaminase family protein [Akkermansiaceae bacterium]
MHLRIFHRTRYYYRFPVCESYNELRLRPATDDKSRLEFFILNVQPPVRLRHFRDGALNYVHYFELAEPHHSLTIEASSVIHTTSQYSDGKPLEVPFSQLKFEERDDLHPYQTSSKYVNLDADAWRLAMDLKQDGIFETAMAVMEYIFENWEYVPNITSASTHASEVMALRKGVCQDFTHIMILLCRSLQIPARYVSGYLYNAPEHEMRGAQASHAWCEVYVPGFGWCGLDPTNNILADERHVKIATGRDYHDAAPISGRFDGPSGASVGMEIKLLVEKIGD